MTKLEGYKVKKQRYCSETEAELQDCDANATQTIWQHLSCKVNNLQFESIFLEYYFLILGSLWNEWENWTAKQDRKRDCPDHDDGIYQEEFKSHISIQMFLAFFPFKTNSITSDHMLVVTGGRFAGNPVSDVEVIDLTGHSECQILSLSNGPPYLHAMATLDLAPVMCGDGYRPMYQC